MIRIIQFYILGIFILSACTKTGNVKDGKVRIGATDCYALDSNETVTGLNEVLENYYLPFAQLGKLQFPVNRVIVSPQQTTFIALSINENISNETIKIAHQKSETVNLINSNDSTFLLQVDTLYNTRFVKNINNNTYFINIVTTDSALANFNFKNRKIIDEKINCTF